MDYEKKYKEALEWARKVMQGKVGFVLDEVLEIFPELKESEDERIRKELLNAFQESEDSLYMVLTPHRRESFITWLEKQGKTSPILSNSLNIGKVEQKPKFRVGDTIKNKKTNKIFTISDYSLLYEYYHDINHYHEIKFSEQDDWELVEQNHAWSEEDEHKFKVVVNALVEDYEATPELINWFNSLKERVGFEVNRTTTKEWSEEIEGAISLLNDMAEEQEKDYCPHNANNLQKAAYYLETCRPQNRWKPSDYQLEALESATENCAYSEYQDCLRELIRQLKKLRRNKL